MSDDLREQAQLVTRALPRLIRHLFVLDEDDPAGMLSVAQLRVCAVLAEGPVPMSTISHDLAMSLSAMTQIADRLQKAGYVRRVRDEDDRRVRVLQLTPRAERAMRKRHERHVERVMDLLGHLPHDARDDLVRALTMLEAALPGPEPGQEADVETLR